MQNLYLRCHDSPELAEYLSGNGRKWLSHDVQNEILRLISRKILSILEEIRSCEYFSILLDETPDAAQLEQNNLRPSSNKRIYDIRIFSGIF